MTHRGAFAMRSGSTASWAVPANTSKLIATACGCVRPALTMATPATIPQGTMPTRSPTEARPPSRRAETCARCISGLEDSIASFKPTSHGNVRLSWHSSYTMPFELIHEMDRQARSVTNCRKLAEGVELFDYCAKIPEGVKFIDFRAMVPLTAKQEVGRFAATHKEGGGPHECICVRPDSRHHFGGACACRLPRKKGQASRRRRR